MEFFLLEALSKQFLANFFGGDVLSSGKYFFFIFNLIFINYIEVGATLFVIFDWFSLSKFLL